MADSTKRRLTVAAIGIVAVLCLTYWLRGFKQAGLPPAPVRNEALSVPVQRIDALPPQQERKVPVPAFHEEAKRASGYLRVFVCDIDGMPASGAMVSLQYAGPPHLASEEDAFFQETTDHVGIAEFTGMKLGRAFVLAERGELRSDQRLIGFEERLCCQEVLLILQHAGKARGRVIDENGLPIAGARVVVCEKDESGIMPAVDAPDVRYTDIEGHFEFAQLPEGLYRFRAFVDGYAPGDSDPVFADGTTEAVIRLTPGSRISGIVRDAQSRTALAGFPVVMRRRDTRGEQAKTLETDSLGKFEFAGLSLGAYTLQSGDATRIFTAGAVDIEVSKAAPKTDLEILAQEGVLVRGHVLREGSETPVVGVKVSALHTSGGGPPRSFQPTDTNGEFQLVGVAPGPNNFMVESNGSYLSAQMALTVPRAAMVEQFNIHIPPAATVEGVVVDGDDQPVPGALVNVATWKPGTVREGMGRGTTGNEGKFKITCLYSTLGDTVMIKASRELAESELSGPFTMTEDGLHDIVVRLSGQPTGSVSGRVVNQNGEPVFAFVSARPANERNTFSADELEAWRASPDRWRSGGSARTDVNGHFVILTLQEGDYDMFVAEHNREGYQSARQIAGHVSLNAGQRLTGIELVLDAGAGDITGLVTDEQGRPIAGAYVIAHPDDDIRSNPLNCMSNRSGAYRLANVPEGTYLLRVNFSGYHCRPEKGVSPGQEVNFVLVPNEGTAN